jgi:hypothetical protein
MQQTLGTITMILAIAMVVWALPKQILKNKHEKKCGLALSMIVLPLGVYTSRAIYAFSIGAWFILVPDALGVLFSVILARQYRHCRQR